MNVKNDDGSMAEYEAWVSFTLKASGERGSARKLSLIQFHELGVNPPSDLEQSLETKDLVSPLG